MWLGLLEMELMLLLRLDMAGDGIAVVVVMAGEGVVVVVVVSPSFSSVSRLLPPLLACLVTGVSCPSELLLEDGVLAIPVKR